MRRDPTTSRAQAQEAGRQAAAAVPRLHRPPQAAVRPLGVKPVGLPDAYKDIETVMDAQADLVRKEAKVEPRIVLMAGKPGLV